MADKKGEDTPKDQEEDKEDEPSKKEEPDKEVEEPKPIEKVEKEVVEKVAVKPKDTVIEPVESTSTESKKDKFDVNQFKKEFKKEFRQELESEAQQAQQTQDTQVATIRNQWTEEYSDLAKLGKVPEIKDAKDTNDRGVQAKRNIVTKLGQIVDANKAAGRNFVPSLSQVILAHPEVVKGPAGANLPISGAGQPVDSGASIDHKEIRGKSFEQLTTS